MFGELEKRKQKRHPQPEIQTYVQSKPPVNLEFNSALLKSFDSKNSNFNPNGKWYGAKQTGLLKPQTHNLKKKSVILEFASPSVGSFAPNGRWFGDKATGLLTYPNYIVPNRDVFCFVHS